MDVIIKELNRILDKLKDSERYVPEGVELSKILKLQVEVLEKQVKYAEMELFRRAVLEAIGEVDPALRETVECRIAELQKQAE